MCTAVNFSNRVLYAIFARLIISFKMKEGKVLPANTDYIDYKRDSTASNAVASDFNVVFEPRDKAVLHRCFEHSREQNESLLRENSTKE